jgi:hypothetical protein
VQVAEERANEMLRAAGGSMAVWSQRNALIRMVLAEDRVTELEADVERLTTILARIHAIAVENPQGNDAREAIDTIEGLSRRD